MEDFLFTYYTQKPGQLLRWHPGDGVVLCEAAAARQDWKYYRALDGGELARAGLPPGSTAVAFDREAFLSERREAVLFARIILAGTAARPAQFGCFGLHEWAMVYRQEKFELRHEYLTLRLGGAGTDKVVEDNRIRCSHFDAFRFYTPDAVPLNELSPSRENQRTMEQPGCLHANMDLYKWAYKLTPALPSELVMDCFELSWRVRVMDMQASPYDLTGWGYPAIPIETPAGKAAYVEQQRAFWPRPGTARADDVRAGSALRGPRSGGGTMSGASGSPDPDLEVDAELELTVALSHAPGGPEQVFVLVSRSGQLVESTLPHPRRRWPPSSASANGFFSRNRAHPSCAPSSTAAPRLPWSPAPSTAAR